MMFRTLIPGLALTVLVLAGVGCSSDDSNPVTPAVPALGDPELGAFVEETAVLSQELVDACVLASAGLLRGKEDVAPWWDETSNCWRWSSEDGNSDDPQHTWNRTWDFALTYYQGETAQTQREGADRVTLEVGYLFEDDNIDSDDQEGSRTFSLALALESTQLSRDVFAVSGTGSGLFTGSGTYQGDGYEFSDEIVADVNLSTPLDECPTGSIALDFDLNQDEYPYSRYFNVVFEGLSSAKWQYLRGERDVVRGSHELTCGE